MDDLRERVARAIYAARKPNDSIYDYADAAIAICMEEAAKVAEVNVTECDCSECCIRREIAAAIRARIVETENG